MMCMYVLTISNMVLFKDVPTMFMAVQWVGWQVHCNTQWWGWFSAHDVWDKIQDTMQPWPIRTEYIFRYVYHMCNAADDHWQYTLACVICVLVAAYIMRPLRSTGHCCTVNLSAWSFPFIYLSSAAWTLLFIWYICSTMTLRDRYSIYLCSLIWSITGWYQLSVYTYMHVQMSYFSLTSRIYMFLNRYIKQLSIKKSSMACW